VGKKNGEQGESTKNKGAHQTRGEVSESDEGSKVGDRPGDNEITSAS